MLNVLIKKQGDGWIITFIKGIYWQVFWKVSCPSYTIWKQLCRIGLHHSVSGYHAHCGYCYKVFEFYEFSMAPHYFMSSVKERNKKNV